MLSIQKNKRPNCDVILSAKDFWSLNICELESEEKRKYINKDSFEDKFLLNFIHKKFIKFKSVSFAPSLSRDE
jgi:hypothetical protein